MGANSYKEYLEDQIVDLEPNSWESPKDEERSIHRSSLPTTYRDWYINNIHRNRSRERITGLKTTVLEVKIPDFNRSTKVIFRLKTGKTIKIYTELLQLTYVIQKSNYILDLQKGWDDDNALEISPLVWESAINFLVNYTNHIFDSSKVKIQVPNINPCRDGSIDLSWRTNTTRLLINIGPNQLASYYGDNYNNINGIEGLVELDQVQEFFATWMKFLAELLW